MTGSGDVICKAVHVVSARDPVEERSPTIIGVIIAEKYETYKSMRIGLRWITGITRCLL